VWRAEQWQKNGESSEPMHFFSGRMEFCTLTNHFSLPFSNLKVETNQPSETPLAICLRCWTSDVWVKVITIHW
jgi:hypothetical protein